MKFDHLKITYLKPRFGFNGVSILEHRTAIVPRKDGTGTWVEQSQIYFREGIAVEYAHGHEILVGPAAIVSCELCNERGYTRLDMGKEVITKSR
jgi:hypothetical protein